MKLTRYSMLLLYAILLIGVGISLVNQQISPRVEALGGSTKSDLKFAMFGWPMIYCDYVSLSSASQIEKVNYRWNWKAILINCVVSVFLIAGVLMSISSLRNIFAAISQFTIRDMLKIMGLVGVALVIYQNLNVELINVASKRLGFGLFAPSIATSPVIVESFLWISFGATIALLLATILGKRRRRQTTKQWQSKGDAPH